MFPGFFSRISVVAEVYGMNEVLRVLLIDYGFLALFGVGMDEMQPRVDPQEALVPLVIESEAFVETCLKMEWLQQDHKPYLVPVRGASDADSDLLIARYDIQGRAVNLVAGEFLITISVAGLSPDVLDSQDSVRSFYKEWISRFVQTSDKLAVLPVDVEELGGLWILTRALTDGKGKRRWEPWTWPESIRMAVSKNGDWLSLAIERLPAEMNSMPKGGAARAGQGWFDDFITSKDQKP